MNDKIIEMLKELERKEERQKEIRDVLKSKEYITGEVEELELENLQGVQGLKALRIKINIDSTIESGKSIKREVENAVKHLPELMN